MTLCPTFFWPSGKIGLFSQSFKITPSATKTVRSLELQDVVVLVLVATTQSGLVLSEVFRQVGENIRGVTGIKGYRGRPTYWPEDG